MIICFIIFLMMSYENRPHNLSIIIDMTGKFHTNILGKITINKILKKLRRALTVVQVGVAKIP